ncbi:MAG: hypothetical protein WCH11_05620, partial [Bdellovibrio sp.]
SLGLGRRFAMKVFLNSLSNLIATYKGLGISLRKNQNSFFSELILKPGSRRLGIQLLLVNPLRRMACFGTFIFFFIGTMTLAACSSQRSSRTPSTMPPSSEKNSPGPAGTKNPSALDSNNLRAQQWLKKMRQEHPETKFNYASELLLSKHVDKLARLEAWIPKLQEVLGLIDSISLSEMAGFDVFFQSPIYPLSWTETELDLFEVQMLELLALRESVPQHRVSVFISEKLELSSAALWNQFFSRFKYSLELTKELMVLSTQSFASIEFHSRGTNSSLWRNSADHWQLRIAGVGDPDQLARDLHARKEFFLQIPFSISFMSLIDDDVFSSIFEECMQTASTYFSQRPGLYYPHLLVCSNSQAKAFEYTGSPGQNFATVHYSLGEEWYQIVSDLGDLSLNYSPEGFMKISVDPLSLSELQPSQLLTQIQSLRNLKEKLITSGLTPKELFISSSRSCGAFRGNVRNRVLGICLGASEVEIGALFFNSKGEPIPWDP